MASSQDTWGLHRESQGLPPQWSSGAAASGKALEKGSWEPGQGNYGLQSLEGGLGCFFFFFPLVQRVNEAIHFGMSELLRRGNRPQRQKRWGQKKTSLDNSVHLVGGGVSALSTPTVWTREFRCPHITRRALLWLRAATGINLLGFPWLDSRDRTGKPKRSVPTPRPFSWLLPLPGPHISCLCG